MSVGEVDEERKKLSGVRTLPHLGCGYIQCIMPSLCMVQECVMRGPLTSIRVGDPDYEGECPPYSDATCREREDVLSTLFNNGEAKTMDEWNQQMWLSRSCGAAVAGVRDWHSSLDVPCPCTYSVWGSG